jgi:polyphosphate kinase
MAVPRGHNVLQRGRSLRMPPGALELSPLARVKKAQDGGACPNLLAVLGTSHMARADRKPTKPKALPPAEPAHYLNREMSWLAFNERVLEEAADPAWPLLERLKFFAIFHSNLDEFFMIRVSGLHGQLVQPDVERSPDGLSPREQLTRNAETLRRQLRTGSDLFAKQLVPELSAVGVRIRTWESLDAEMQERARAYFRSAVFPVLTPLAVDPGHPFPFISNLSLSLAVEAEDPEAELRRFARVKVPEILPRFVPLDSFREYPRRVPVPHHPGHGHRDYGGRGR